MVNDYNEGKNYFTQLEVTRDASDDDIKRQFRKLAVKLYGYILNLILFLFSLTVFSSRHPDKVGSDGPYLAISRAYEVLSDPESKKEFEDLLDQGIFFSRPSTSIGLTLRHLRCTLASSILWKICSQIRRSRPRRKVYIYVFHTLCNSYSKKRYVLGGFAMIITVIQYILQWYKHIRYTEFAKQTNRYKRAVKQMQQEKKEKKVVLIVVTMSLLLLQKRKQEDSDEEEEEEGPNITISGAERPELRNLFIVQLVAFPFVTTFYLLRWIVWYNILGKPRPDFEEILAEKYGMTLEEYEHGKKIAEERRQRLLESNKYKRYKRMLKKS